MLSNFPARGRGEVFLVNDIEYATAQLWVREESGIKAMADGTPAERYVYMRRVHKHGGRPYCIIDIYLDAKLFARHPGKFRRQTVIPLLLDMPGLTIVSARQLLTIWTADVDVAQHLEVPVNAPVADVRRVFTDAEGRVVYLGEVTYRGDFVHIEMDLKP